MTSLAACKTGSEEDEAQVPPPADEADKEEDDVDNEDDNPPVPIGVLRVRLVRLRGIRALLSENEHVVSMLLFFNFAPNLELGYD